MALLWIYFAALSVLTEVLESYQRLGQTKAGEKACDWDPLKTFWVEWVVFWSASAAATRNTINWEA